MRKMMKKTLILADQNYELISFVKKYRSKCILGKLVSSWVRKTKNPGTCVILIYQANRKRKSLCRSRGSTDPLQRFVRRVLASEGRPLVALVRGNTLQDHRGNRDPELHSRGNVRIGSLCIRPLHAVLATL